MTRPPARARRRRSRRRAGLVDERRSSSLTLVQVGVGTQVRERVDAALDVVAARRGARRGRSRSTLTHRELAAVTALAIVALWALVWTALPRRRRARAARRHLALACTAAQVAAGSSSRRGAAAGRAGAAPHAGQPDARRAHRHRVHRLALDAARATASTERMLADPLFAAFLSFTFVFVATPGGDDGRRRPQRARRRPTRRPARRGRGRGRQHHPCDAGRAGRRGAARRLARRPAGHPLRRRRISRVPRAARAVDLVGASARRRRRCRRRRTAMPTTAARVEGLTVNLLSPVIPTFYLAAVPTFIRPTWPRGAYVVLAVCHVDDGLRLPLVVGARVALDARGCSRNPAPRRALGLATARGAAVAGGAGPAAMTRAWPRPVPRVVPAGARARRARRHGRLLPW